MKKYFLYELKKNAFAICFLAVFAIAEYTIPLMSQKAEYLKFNNNFAQISFTAGFIACMVPVWVFNYRMKRRSVDLYFSLPLSHTKILTVKYLIGLIAVFLPYTLAFWLGSFVIMYKLHGIYNLAYIPALYACSLLPIFCLYTLVSFIYTRANKPVDGLVFVIMWMFAGWLLINFLDRFTGYSSTVFHPEYYTFFSPLSETTRHFNGLISGGDSFYYNNLPTLSEEINMGIAYSITGLLSVAATAGIFLCENHTKAENAGQISESLYGYRVLIPLYAFILMSGINFSYPDEIFFVVLLCLGVYLLSVLYKRTAKIGRIHFISCVSALAAGLIFSAILSFI